MDRWWFTCWHQSDFAFKRNSSSLTEKIVWDIILWKARIADCNPILPVGKNWWCSPWSFHLDHNYSSVKFQSTFSETISSAVFLSSYFKFFFTDLFLKKIWSQVFLKSTLKWFTLITRFTESLGEQKTYDYGSVSAVC